MSVLAEKKKHICLIGDRLTASAVEIADGMIRRLNKMYVVKSIMHKHHAVMFAILMDGRIMTEPQITYPIYESDLAELEAFAGWATGAHADAMRLVKRVVAECRRLREENALLKSQNGLPFASIDKLEDLPLVVIEELERQLDMIEEKLLEKLKLGKESC